MFIILTLIFSFQLQAQTDCIPQNSIMLPPMAGGGITYREFREVIDEVEGVFGPVIAAKGKTLVINDEWKDPEVNAQAYRMGNQWMVDAFGGLARYPGMTKAAYQMVLCHEVGHHIGGEPKSSWASVEGQSDYWAARSCIKHFEPAEGFGGLSSTRKSAC